MIMKNKRINIPLTLLLGLLFLIKCGCARKKSAVIIPPSLFATGEPELSLSETTHNFGGVVVNNNADREFKITNTGTGGLDITDISSDNAEFTIIYKNCYIQPLLSTAT